MIIMVYFFGLFLLSHKLDAQPPVKGEGDVMSIRGICLTAPPRPFTSDPCIEIKQLSANWIAVIPFAFQAPGSPSVQYDPDGKYWWGESPEGIEETIRLARNNGLKVLLKPQVWIRGSWPGDVTFESEEEWSAWERSYRAYILRFAVMAAELDIEVLCIGTEFKRSVRDREMFWVDLIREIRQIYSGQLTYAANWDAIEANPLWEYLDIIGINAYFPLSDSQTPTVEELIRSWKPTEEKIRHLSERFNLPVVFTEYGYLSVDHCARRPWEHDRKLRSSPVNELGQANALIAMYKVFSRTDYWLGGFLWKWYPYEGRSDRSTDYTPQNKIAEEAIRAWFMKN